MTTEEIPITIAGEQALQAELHELESVKRPQVIEAIAEARAHGDLKENAEYHAAKEMQSFIESRIIEIKNKLAFAKVIDVTKIPNNGYVVFGATVHLINTATDEKFVYQIVGDPEANIKANKMSISSPIARALVGKKVGDEVEVQTPGGLIEFEILQVEYI